jgi:hypothetical protein
MAYTRKNERAKSRLQLHIKRVTAQMVLMAGDPAESESEKTEPEKLSIRIVLNDITPTGVGIYVPRLLHKGQEGTLNMTNPMPVSVKFRVVWSREFNVDSHVLTDQAFAYRAGLQFQFSSDEEKVQVTELCEQIERDGIRHLSQT